MRRAYSVFGYVLYGIGLGFAIFAVVYAFLGMAAMLATEILR
jgi:hypothetical protein